MRSNRTIAGKEHRVVVLRVKARDAKGRPTLCEVGFDDHVFKLEQNDEFITAWIPVVVERHSS